MNECVIKEVWVRGKEVPLPLKFTSMAGETSLAGNSLCSFLQKNLIRVMVLSKYPVPLPVEKG